MHRIWIVLISMAKIISERMFQIPTLEFQDYGFAMLASKSLLILGVWHAWAPAHTWWNNSFELVFKSIHNWKCHLILVYHFKKLFYQLYHTILQHTQHSNFYFPILLVKIIYIIHLNNIIYSNTTLPLSSPPSLFHFIN